MTKMDVENLMDLVDELVDLGIELGKSYAVQEVINTRNLEGVSKLDLRDNIMGCISYRGTDLVHEDINHIYKKLMSLYSQIPTEE